MRELQRTPPGAGAAERLVREHLIAHLDADLRWLELATDLLPSSDGQQSLRTPAERKSP
jgi:hypothetical protein